jgi:hypothetical protein
MNPLKELLGYLLKSGDVNHTAPLITGILDEGLVTVVVGMERDATRVQQQVADHVAQLRGEGVDVTVELDIVPVGSLPQYLHGHRRPLVCDHSAVELMLRMAMEDVRKVRQDQFDKGQKHDLMVSRAAYVAGQLVLREWHMNHEVRMLRARGLDLSESPIIASQLCLAFDIAGLPKDDPRREELTLLYQTTIGASAEPPTNEQLVAFGLELFKR